MTITQYEHKLIFRYVAQDGILGLQIASAGIIYGNNSFTETIEFKSEAAAKEALLKITNLM